jgi:transcriptional repressor NrdR
LHCPFCKNPDSKVVDSRLLEDGFTIRRRRVCTNESCAKRFSTLETTTLYVQKRSGVLEQFDKYKLISGVRKAFQGRAVDEDVLLKLAGQIEDDIRGRGVSQIDSYDIGLALLSPLFAIDEVAYLRFASVYQNFDSLEDFEKEIAKIRATAKETVESE